MTKKYKFIVKKPKIINIFNNNYTNLTCIIWAKYSLINKNNKTDKMKIFNLKLFYDKKLFTINKFLSKENISKKYNEKISNINLFYNRNNIKLYLVTIDSNTNTNINLLKSYNKFFMYRYIDTDTDTKYIYKQILKNSFNNHINEYLYTNYFSIKYKYLINTILLNY